MRTLTQMLAEKPAPVTVGPEDRVYEALSRLARHDIGALLVVNKGKLVGIFSERDYARKVVLHGKASKDIPVKEIMSEKVCYVTPSHSVEDCMALMTDRRVRHLPVLGSDEEVLGIVSIGDLVKETLSEQKFIIDQLEHYITH